MKVGEIWEYKGHEDIKIKIILVNAGTCEACEEYKQNDHKVKILWIGRKTTNSICRRMLAQFYRKCQNENR